MKTLNVWWPGHRILSYREPRQQFLGGYVIAAALDRIGVRCYPSFRMPPGCDLVFLAFGTCGSREHLEQYERHPEVPVVEYNWDLHPDFLRREKHMPAEIERLRHCAHLVVPSSCCLENVRSILGKEATVVRTAARPLRWPTRDGGYVLDPLRKNHDPTEGWAAACCRDLGIPCVETGGDLSFDDFMDAVAGARVIACTSTRASTGGLTLLEGYALGKPILFSDSPRNGAADYFAGIVNESPWVRTYRHDDREDLKAKLAEMHQKAAMDGPDPQQCWQWVSTEHSPERMAAELKEVFEETLTGRRP